MKKLIILFLFCYCSCDSLKVPKEQDEISKLFKIEDIKSKNSWNIIYASKNDTLYKIITKKIKTSRCNKIMIGESYNIILNETPNNYLIINGLKINKTPSRHINCFGYDNETDICLERERGINYLYSAKNILGLCLEK